MIDVWAVAANALWVLGLALALAALSWAHWVTTRDEIGMHQALEEAGVRRVLDLGLLLFCAGMAAISRRPWERGLWVLLALAWAVQIALSLRAQRRTGGR